MCVCVCGLLLRFIFNHRINITFYVTNKVVIELTV